MTGDLPPEAWEENPPSRQASGPATPRGMPTVSLDLARSILGAARTPALLCAARIMGSRVFRTVSRYTFSSTAVSEATGTTTCGHRRGHWPRRFRARRGRRGKGRKGAESGGGYHSSYPRLKVEEHSCHLQLVECERHTRTGPAAAAAEASHDGHHTAPYSCCKQTVIVLVQLYGCSYLQLYQESASTRGAAMYSYSCRLRS
jgi:hypothetical protein